MVVIVRIFLMHPPCAQTILILYGKKKNKRDNRHKTWYIGRDNAHHPGGGERVLQYLSILYPWFLVFGNSAKIRGFIWEI